MQVLTALLTDPGYRREGDERFRKNIDNFFNTLDATPRKALASALGGSCRTMIRASACSRRRRSSRSTMSAYEESIGDRLSHGAIELALAGDFDETQAIAAVAATLGALPPREPEFLPREGARTRSFTAQRGPRVVTHAGEADQALLQWTWPTTDDSDQAETLRLGLLARALRNVLTDTLREELGQAYSPSASAGNSRYFHGYGTFSLSASVDLAEVAATRAAVAKVLSDLRAAPLSADLIERARRPLLEEIDDALKDLGGWIGLAARAQSEPDRLARWHAAPDLIRAITPEDLHQTALRWLTTDGAVEVLVEPAAK